MNLVELAKAAAEQARDPTVRDAILERPPTCPLYDDGACALGETCTEDPFGQGYLRCRDYGNVEQRVIPMG